jgi:hypothetical protein
MRGAILASVGKSGPQLPLIVFAALLLLPLACRKQGGSASTETSTSTRPSTETPDIPGPITATTAPLALRTEMLAAAKNGDLDKIKSLLKDNPDLVASRDDSQDTPLLIAVFNNHKEVVGLLLANRADVNAKDKDGFSPLMIAAVTSEAEILQLLIDNKADVNARDNKGCTALFYAAPQGDIDILRLLFTHKADIDAKNNDGKTPTEYAANGGFPALKAFLNAKQMSESAPSASQPSNDDIYRQLQPRDGFTAAAYVADMGFTFDGTPSGTLTKFGLIDSQGNFHDLELESNEFKDGEIKTKLLGIVRATTVGATSMTYSMTETQIEKARAYLEEQKKQ